MNYWMLKMLKIPLTAIIYMGKESLKRVDTCICIIYTLCYTVETIATLKINYTLIKIFKNTTHNRLKIWKIREWCADKPAYVQDCILKKISNAERNQGRTEQIKRQIMLMKGTVNVVKVSILSKFICRSPAFVVIVEIYKLNLKCFWKYRDQNDFWKKIIELEELELELKSLFSRSF